jgi:hypothetical protein
LKRVEHQRPINNPKRKRKNLRFKIADKEALNSGEEYRLHPPPRLKETLEGGALVAISP